VSQLNELENNIRKLVPGLRTVIAHGQMNGARLEEIILDFMNHDYDMLICTSIIENGIDIPNANTIFINNAHQFGLSDLHQLRGRVGRTNRKAFCYLFGPPWNYSPRR
jgi:transcription-repair coupling factor (superfamily II helicase)